MGNCLLARKLDTYRVIYDHGDECTSITGGWTAGTSSGNATKNSDNLYFGRGSQGVGSGWFTTNNSINLSGYNSIILKIQIKTNNGEINNTGLYIKSNNTDIIDYISTQVITNYIWLIFPIINKQSGNLQILGRSTYQYTSFYCYLYKMILTNVNVK